MINATRFGKDSNFRRVRLDLCDAVPIVLPETPQVLDPHEFTTSDGRSGWVVRLPDGRPIATPTFGDDLIFVGGGFGSYVFFAFDAKTGRLVWQIRTKDDGPTAAVFEDSLVAFNTESCTVVVCEAATGKIVWQEWLGDPLLSQPAIGGGRLYMAYPARDRNGFSHRLLCADVRTGTHLWEREITSDVITSPVIAGEHVFLSCFDGTSFCLRCEDGHVVWQRRDGATSAPSVSGSDVFHSRKVDDDGKVCETVHRSDAQEGKDKDTDPFLAEKAAYLRDGPRTGLKAEQLYALDASVGFGTAPQSAKLHMAAAHLGVRTVAGAWGFQGSRPQYFKGRVMNAQGKFIHSFRSEDAEGSWRAEATGGDSEHSFTPPSLGKEYLYLCSADGLIASLKQVDGERGFLYSTDQSIMFQPALAKGNVYVGTANGLVWCLRTGTDDADGWHMWGGNAQHNKSA